MPGFDAVAGLPIAGLPAAGPVTHASSGALAADAASISGAALDVFADEPRVPDALRQSPATVLTPHIASASLPTRLAMADLAADNLIALLQGGAAITPVPTPSPRS